MTSPRVQDGTFGGGLTDQLGSEQARAPAFDTSVFAGDQLLATSNTNTVIDNVSGQLRDLSVASFFDGVETPDFDIALLTFTAWPPGVSALTPRSAIHQRIREHLDGLR